MFITYDNTSFGHFISWVVARKNHPQEKLDVKNLARIVEIQDFFWALNIICNDLVAGGMMNLGCDMTFPLLFKGPSGLI